MERKKGINNQFLGGGDKNGDIILFLPDKNILGNRRLQKTTGVTKRPEF
jgi:hypothetical protein